MYSTAAESCAKSGLSCYVRTYVQCDLFCTVGLLSLCGYLPPLHSTTVHLLGCDWSRGGPKRPSAECFPRVTYSHLMVRTDGDGQVRTSKVCGQHHAWCQNTRERLIHKVDIYSKPVILYYMVVYVVHRSDVRGLQNYVHVYGGPTVGRDPLNTVHLSIEDTA